MEDSGIDSDPKANNHVEDENQLVGSDSSCSSNPTPPQRSTTKLLQKKLEARIEQAKRIQRNAEYTKVPANDSDSCGVGNSNSLIPIQRLPIPQKRKKQNMLVEYWHSDSDGEDEMTLFPTTRGKSLNHKDPSDPFSIEELSEGSEDSLNLGSTQSPNPHIRTYTPSSCFCCQCHIF